MVEKRQLEQLVFLDDIEYYREHTWARVKDQTVIIGISDFAQDQLGDIVFVELPAVGDTFAKGDVFGQAESVKSISSLYIPIGGEILAVNHNLEDSPEIVNTDPYGEGWMIVVKPNQLVETKDLLTKAEYISFLKEA